MKKRITRGEKWLFATPLLFLMVAGALWQWRKAKPHSVELPEYNTVSAIEFSPDGQRLVVVSTNRSSETLGQIYDLESRSVKAELELPKRLPTGMKSAHIWGGLSWPSWSPDGKQLVAGTYVGNGGSLVQKIVIWDADGGRIQNEFFYGKPAESNSEETFYFSSDGKKLIGQGTPSSLFDAATGQRLNKPDTRFSQTSFEAWLNEKLGLVAVSDRNPSLQVVDFKTKRLVWKPKLNDIRNFGWKNDILWVNDSKYSDFGKETSQNRLWLWDGKTRQQLLSPPLIPKGEITGSRFNPDGRSLAYFAGSRSSADGELTVWDYKANRVLWRAAVPLGEYHLLELPFANLQSSPDGKKLAIVCNNRLTVFDQNGKMRYERKPTGDFCVWSPDSRQLAIGITDRNKSDIIVSNRVEMIGFED